jgi:hypothetical protein
LYRSCTNWVSTAQEYSGEDGFLLAEEFLPDAVLLTWDCWTVLAFRLLQRFKENPKNTPYSVHGVRAGPPRSRPGLPGAVICQAVEPRTAQRGFTNLENKLTQKPLLRCWWKTMNWQRESVMRLIADDEVNITAVRLAGGAGATQLTIFDRMIGPEAARQRGQ